MISDVPHLGLRQASLSLCSYDPKWPVLFDQEAARISQALPDQTVEIEHIGSTSVPDLPAKPILDIAVRSDQAELIAKALAGLGYIDRGPRSGRLFIRLRDGNIRTHNLHLYAPDAAEFADQIAFRDALRSDPEMRKAYAKLKRNLVRELGDAGRGQYAGRKSEFVSSVLQSL